LSREKRDWKRPVEEISDCAQRRECVTLV
jgi:hypothetical protein